MLGGFTGAISQSRPEMSWVRDVDKMTMCWICCSWDVELAQRIGIMFPGSNIQQSLNTSGAGSIWCEFWAVIIPGWWIGGSCSLLPIRSRFRAVLIIQWSMMIWERLQFDYWQEAKQAYSICSSASETIRDSMHKELFGPCLTFTRNIWNPGSRVRSLICREASSMFLSLSWIWNVLVVPLFLTSVDCPFIFWGLRYGPRSWDWCLGVFVISLLLGWPIPWPFHPGWLLGFFFWVEGGISCCWPVMSLMGATRLLGVWTGVLERLWFWIRISLNGLTAGGYDCHAQQPRRVKRERISLSRE